MCSIDYYGFFVGLQEGHYIPAIIPDVQVYKDENNEFKPLYHNGYLDLDSESLTERNLHEFDENVNTYRLLQTQGYMSRHRPCYVVTDNAPQRLIRLTTVFNPYMDLASTDAAGKSDMYNTDYPEP